jgi:hypothetical protein
MATSLQAMLIPWSDFPAECFWYFWATGVLHLVAFVVGVLVFACLSVKQPGRFLSRTRHLAGFLALFLVVGALFNGLWSCLIYERFYHSSDYVCGFVPFWPFTKYWMSAFDSDGQLMEVPIKMDVFWFLFAAATWSITILVYRLFVPLPPIKHYFHGILIKQWKTG